MVQLLSVFAAIKHDMILQVVKHFVSVYTPHRNPTKKLWFKKLLGRTETNPSMQILEVPNTSYDIEDILRVVNYAVG